MKTVTDIVVKLSQSTESGSQLLVSCRPRTIAKLYVNRPKNSHKFAWSVTEEVCCVWQHLSS